jgi:hypothetical protein
MKNMNANNIAPTMARTATVPRTMPAIAPPERLDDVFVFAVGPEVLLLKVDDEELVIAEEEVVGKSFA